MQTILITGLDGSGKTTILKKLQAKAKNKAGFIFLPDIETETVKQNPELYRAACFINFLGKFSDKEKIPQLKAVALFASVLIFEELIKETPKTCHDFLFFERHPLVDTGIYAQFYASKLKAGSISPEIINEIDTNYKQELNYILRFIPPELFDKQPSPTENLMNFIYDFFYIKEGFRFSKLKTLFKLELPDKIYFLQAKAEILYDRIKHRKRKEAHESIEVFRKLNSAYLSHFKEMTENFPKMKKQPEIINADNTENLDVFAEFINLQFHNLPNAHRNFRK